jgi:gas vesicle protein
MKNVKMLAVLVGVVAGAAAAVVVAKVVSNKNNKVVDDNDNDEEAKDLDNDEEDLKDQVLQLDAMLKEAETEHKKVNRIRNDNVKMLNAVHNVVKSNIVSQILYLGIMNANKKYNAEYFFPLVAKMSGAGDSEVSFTVNTVEQNSQGTDVDNDCMEGSKYMAESLKQFIEFYNSPIFAFPKHVGKIDVNKNIITVKIK